MTANTKISPLSDASAFITSIVAAIRPNVGAVTVNSNGQRVYADAQKTLSL